MARKSCLLIAEKPSVARDIQSVYKTLPSSYDYNITFANCAGHLVSLSEPNEYCEEWGVPWRIEQLPMIPEKWLSKVTVPDLFNRIKQEFDSGKYDYIINACDAGREGELIFYRVYDEIGKPIPVLRYWASDPSPDTVKQALNDLKPSSVYDNLKKAAYCRAWWDWLIGMNFTRASRLKTKYEITVGRVMTPTLGMIVNRELEITNFVPKQYFEAVGTFITDEGEKYEGILLNNDANQDEEDKYCTRFDDKNILEGILNSIGNIGKITDMKTEKQTNYAPRLFNISELQKEGAKVFGYSPDKTLSIAQSLYEKHKVLSYPRTESQYLSDNLASTIIKNLKAIVDVPGVQSYVNDIINNPSLIASVMKSKRYVDNKKLTDHHAIIPTNVTPNLSGFTADEKNIYELVCKRFVAIFLKPNIVNKLSMNTTFNDTYKFRTTGKTLIDAGWKALYSMNSKDIELPSVKEGDNINKANVNIQDKLTTPPQRYTDDTLISAMEHAGKNIDDEELKEVMNASHGLGTGATRAEIIKKLFTNNYVEKKGTGKLKYIFPTEKGMKVIELLKGQDVISPEFTAEWEKKLSDMENGEYDYDTFYSEMVEYISTTTSVFIDTLEEQAGSSSKSNIVAKCPECGKDVLEGKNSYLCIDYLNYIKRINAEKEGKNAEATGSECQFRVPKLINKAKITQKDLQVLIGGKQIEKTLKWDNGTSSANKLYYDKEKHAVQRVKPNNTEPICKCPKCGEDIVEGNSSFYCKNVLNMIKYNEALKKGETLDLKTCDFSLSKNFGKSTMTKQDILDLVTKGETTEHLFTWGNGNKSKTKLILDDNKNIAFPKINEKIDCVGTCPLCNGTLKLNTDRGFYFCENSKKTCNAPAVGININKADISVDEAILLIKGESLTKTFTWKNGKSGEATICYKSGKLDYTF